MNRYDEVFDFRLATIEDCNSIMKFLKEEWNENHILVKDQSFFLWQYGNEQYGDKTTINFVLMLDKQGEIVGANGFIPYAPYCKNRCVSSAITKVKSDLPIPMCGIELIKRFRQLVPAKYYYSSGTNPQTLIPIAQKVFRYDVGIMQQFYMLNPSISEYRIADIKTKKYGDVQNSPVILEQIQNIDDVVKKYNFDEEQHNQGYKTKEYFIKRYIQHPIYHYQIYALKLNTDKYIGILVGRIITVNNASIIRFVDYLGDIENIPKIAYAINRLIIDNRYEYADLVVSNLPKDSMEESGFYLRNAEDENIIPMYFEPFIRKNIDIWFQRNDAKICIFKADGDQDRPNYSKKEENENE